MGSGCWVLGAGVVAGLVWSGLVCTRFGSCYPRIYSSVVNLNPWTSGSQASVRYMCVVVGGGCGWLPGTPTRTPAVQRTFPNGSGEAAPARLSAQVLLSTSVGGRDANEATCKGQCRKYLGRHWMYDNRCSVSATPRLPSRLA